ncbi:BA14K family protein [Bradyrhizobium symbiodeficiens]
MLHRLATVRRGGRPIARFRSFDPISGTYLGRDGRRHYCR